MIPHRMLSSAIYGSGLKGRVIACRKRLRLNRATHATVGGAGVNDHGAEVFPETALTVLEFDDRTAGDLPGRAAMTTSIVSLEPVSLVEAQGTESMLLAGSEGLESRERS
jgi:hypothetical protein